MFKRLEQIFETTGWLRIMMSPLLLGIIIGVLVYLSEPNALRLVIGSTIALIGLIIGIIWANRVKKKQSTISFLARIMANPELEKNETKQK